MNSSILNNVKKVLGIAEDYTVFDTDILMHINSAFVTIRQLGVGPSTGFFISGAEDQWDDFFAGDSRLNIVKSLLFLKVKLLFDPPGTSYLITLVENQIKEMEWRLNVLAEGELQQEPRTVDAKELGLPYSSRVFDALTVGGEDD